MFARRRPRRLIDFSVMGSANQPRLVFLISVPRSGSTLLQKILAAHPDVASTGEPWILLPLGFLDRDHGMEAIYSHRTAAKGIREMIEKLPGGRQRYIAHLRQFCMALFQDLALEKKYFLDKDPRYYLILDFLVELFPESRFIFLFRNPLDVMCSMMSTWLKGRLMLHAYHIDLYDGVRLMAQNSRKYANRSINVQYEDLVSRPNEEVRRICEFLEIPHSENLLLNYKQVEFGGSMGDPIGVYRYNAISNNSVNTWPKLLNNWYRIRFARSYLRALGDDILEPWGINVQEFDRIVGQSKVYFRGSIADMVNRRLSDIWRFISGTRLREALRDRKIREVYLFR
jgi:hypothetical protein